MSDSEDIYYDSDEAGDFAEFDDSGDDIESIASRSKGKDADLSLSVPFRSFNPEELQAEIDREVEVLVPILGVDRDLALTFLLHYRWNRDKLIEQYFESPSRVLSDVGDLSADTLDTRLGSDSNPPKKRVRRTPSPTPSDSICGVCFDDSPDPSLIPRIKCRHTFCRDCWNTYLSGNIRSEGKCSIRCIAPGCKMKIPESFIKGIVEGGVYERWRTLIAQSFVESTSLFRFCPAPSCSGAVQCSTSPSAFLNVPTVKCSDSHVFCFCCGLEGGHTPVICKIAEMWTASRDDSGTTAWLVANTRKCPNCTRNIEKNGGCNRMLCRHCHFLFCWACLRGWKTHDYNRSVCNSYKEPEPTSEMNQAKANLERWIFYYDRFNNHEVSAELDRQVAGKVEEKMEQVQRTTSLTWIETDFLQHAVVELTNCRQTLKWTYAMAHFLASGNKKQIFEDIQADLEKAVEHLSQLVDEPIDPIDPASSTPVSLDAVIKDLRRRMMDKAVYLKKRHERLLTYIARGMEDGYWDWIKPVY